MKKSASGFVILLLLGSCNPIGPETEIAAQIDSGPHAIYEYRDTTHFDPDSGSYIDRLSYSRFDSTDHIEIVEYSGRIMDPPTRFYVNFYNEDNVNIDSQYYFHAKSFVTSPMAQMDKQELSAHCFANGKKMEVVEGR